MMDFSLGLQSFDQHRLADDKHSNKNSCEDALKEQAQENHLMGTMLPDADGFIPPGPVTSQKPKSNTSDFDGQGDRTENYEIEAMSVGGTPEESSITSLQSVHAAGNGSSSSQVPLVTDLLTEMGQAMKMNCSHWAQVFQESQEFETFCPTRLDKMLAEARALEEDLIKQKEKLRLRLQAISKTLQTIS
ncbi:uncharacterized protein [Ptychodera flava]|uniref:uncharacterized protein n=1 Tax=Ptychodera flava TaxID=63121 RepID=UPI003969F835